MWVVRPKFGFMTQPSFKHLLCKFMYSDYNYRMYICNRIVRVMTYKSVDSQLVIVDSSKTNNIVAQSAESAIYPPQSCHIVADQLYPTSEEYPTSLVQSSDLSLDCTPEEDQHKTDYSHYSGTPLRSTIGTAQSSIHASCTLFCIRYNTHMLRKHCVKL